MPGIAIPPGTGLIRVHHRAPFALSPGIADARLEGAEPGALTGNAGPNRLEGGPGDDVIDGRGGNDRLRLGDGRDAVLFGPDSGDDLVEDFRPGEDRVWITAGPRSPAALRAALQDTPAGARLTIGESSLTFGGLRAAELPDAAFELPVDPAAWPVTFHDGFERLSRFDAQGAGTWRTRIYHGDGRTNARDEVQTYVDPSWRGLGLDPLSVRRGVLRIEARRRPDLAPLADGRDYISGLMTTEANFAQTYGWFEARMRMPAGIGTFPAFWLLPTDHAWPPEMDVVEVLGRAPDEVFQMGVTTKGLVDSSDGFHTYAMEWSPDRVAWYIDGRMMAVQRPPFQARLLREAPRPMYLLLNLAVGGEWAKNPVIGRDGRGSAEGVLEVDYVRVRAHPERLPAPRTVAPPRVAFAGAPRAPGLPGRVGYVAELTGRLNFTLEDLGVAGPDYLRLETVNDRTTDRYEASLRNGWGDLRSVSVEDVDGGTFVLSDLAEVALRLGGRSDVTIHRARAGTVETGPGNDTVRLPEARGWNAAPGTRIRVTTGAGNDTVEGWPAPAGLGLEVEGGPGNDRITGSADDDRIAGGAGADMLRGGGGADIFLFRRGEDGAKRVEDFEPGRDRLRFEGIALADLSATPAPGGTRLRLPGGASVMVIGLDPARWREAVEIAGGIEDPGGTPD